MSRDNISIGLVSMDCEDAIGDEKDPALMLSKAFKAAKNHWMVLEEDPQLKGALNAVLTKMGEDHPDRERLVTDIRLLGQLNAFLNAAQAGLSPEIPSIPEGHNTLGLMKIWHETAR